uniref:FK506-binding protein 15-like domain-containing protein n=1 Tax=Amblyomma parvum TaxID=251391 RepID=A0A023FS16_AMBPA
MEESNTMFEQRSDTLHSSAAHSQARLLALEAEKMEVSERLNQALSELTLLKAELNEKQHKESQTLKELGEWQSALEGNRNILKSFEDSLKEAEQEKQDLARQIEGYKDAASAKKNADLSPEQIAELEESISARWKSVCDTETKKLNARISALEAEKESLSVRVVELDSKCKELATGGEKERQAYEDKIRQLQLDNQASSTGAASATSAFDFDAELKKIMNTLFKLLQREFSHEETYSSKEAKGIILNSIRDFTTAVLERRQASAGLGNGTSRASPTSTSSNSSAASPAAADAAADAAAEATVSQPQQSTGGRGKQKKNTRTCKRAWKFSLLWKNFRHLRLQGHLDLVSVTSGQSLHLRIPVRKLAVMRWLRQAKMKNLAFRKKHKVLRRLMMKRRLTVAKKEHQGMQKHLVHHLKARERQNPKLKAKMLSRQTGR